MRAGQRGHQWGTRKPTAQIGPRPLLFEEGILPFVLRGLSICLLLCLPTAEGGCKRCSCALGLILGVKDDYCLLKEHRVLVLETNQGAMDGDHNTERTEEDTAFSFLLRSSFKGMHKLGFKGIGFRVGQRRPGKDSTRC